MRRLGWEPPAMGSLRFVVSGAMLRGGSIGDKELLGCARNGCCYDRRAEHEGYEAKVGGRGDRQGSRGAGKPR